MACRGEGREASHERAHRRAGQAPPWIATAKRIAPPRALTCCWTATAYLQPSRSSTAVFLAVVGRAGRLTGPSQLFCLACRDRESSCAVDGYLVSRKGHGISVIVTVRKSRGKTKREKRRSRLQRRKEGFNGLSQKQHWLVTACLFIFIFLIPSDNTLRLDKYVVGCNYSATTETTASR